MKELELEALQQTNFTGLDWGIVIVYLLASLVIGLLVKRYATNMAAYVGAGRSLGVCLGIATMTGTEMGLITVMYSAQKGFAGGFAAFHIALLAGIVTLAVGLSGFIVSGLRRLEVLTIPEFYERRFGPRTRILGGIMLVFGGVLNMGLFLQVGSKFIVGITGMAADGRALPAVMTGLLTLVLVYTVLGGMISVVITDYIQFVVLSLGMILAVLLAIGHLGWDNIFQTVADRMGEKGFDPISAEGDFGWAYVAWMAITAGLVSCAIWPTAVARALAMESPEAVKRQYAFSSISFMVRFMVPNFLGICAFVFVVTEAPDLNALFFPAEGSGVEAFDNLYAMPVFLGRILPVGLVGLISAAMIAAFMSTHDSYLLCWSSVITQDIVAPMLKGQLTTRARILLTRVLIVIIGLYILAWGLLYDGGDDVWDYMAITGAIYFTGAMPLLVGGLYWRGASSTGAFCCLLAGSSAVFGLGPLRDATLKAVEGRFSYFYESLYLEHATGAHVGLAAVAFATTVFVVASLLFPDSSRQGEWTDHE